MKYRKYRNETSEQKFFKEELHSNMANRPPNDFIVSYTKDGSELSKYGDDFWDRTPYSANGRKLILRFKFWKKGGPTTQRNLLKDEIRWFMYILIFLRNGQVLANGTLKQYKAFFHLAARFSEVNNITIQQLFSSDDLFFECLKDKPLMIHFGCSFIGLLESIGIEVIGFLPVRPSTTEKLRKIKNELISQFNQHSPLPTRIYSHVLSQLSVEIETFNSILGPVLVAYNKCIEDPLYGRDRASQRRIAKKLDLPSGEIRPNFRQILKDHTLDKFWAERNYYESFNSLKKLLIEMMVAASLQIQAYSGMRQGEVEILPYDCLEVQKNNLDQSFHYIIHGFTTKKSRGKRMAAKWITCETAVKAIRLIQEISRVLYKSKGLNPEEPSDGQIFYLFLSPDFVRVENAPPYLHVLQFEDLRNRLQPIIQDSDIKELEQIDPHRAWRAEDDFQIGRPWNLSTHQFRRSLALYAHRSGIVSLTSLKRQLQQITHEMASYYSRGGSFAKSLVGFKDHIAYEWQETEPVSQYLGYVVNVLLNDDLVFGAHQKLSIEKSTNDDGVVVVDKDALLKLFKKGGIAYTDTILGGCVKVGPCNLNPVDLLHIECIKSNCKNLVGNKHKLELVVTAETNLVNKLKVQDPDSSMYRHEEANLRVLNEALKAISNKS